MPRNIPFTIFFGPVFSELPRIERYTLRLNNFIPRACNLLSRMAALGGNRATLTKQLKKTFHCYPTVFSKIW